jgi:hypothetical protein
MVEEENANELQFGEEFKDVHCLTVDEMYILLVDRKDDAVSAVSEFFFVIIHSADFAT